MKAIPDPEPLPVAVRAYSESRRKGKKAAVAGTYPPSNLKHSEWALVFDTETTTDSAQQLRFGAYQVRRSTELWEAGLFHDPRS